MTVRLSSVTSDSVRGSRQVEYEFLATGASSDGPSSASVSMPGRFGRLSRVVVDHRGAGRPPVLIEQEGILLARVAGHNAMERSYPHAPLGGTESLSVRVTPNVYDGLTHDTTIRVLVVEGAGHGCRTNRIERVTGYGTTQSGHATIAVDLPASAIILVAGIRVTPGGSQATDAAYRVVDAEGITLLKYELDPADPRLEYSSQEYRPVPVGGTATIKVDTDSAGSGASVEVYLDYRTE